MNNGVEREASVRQVKRVMLEREDGCRSPQERAILRERIRRAMELTPDQAAWIQTFAGSHAALGGPTAGTDGPSTSEPKTGDVGPKSPKNPTGPAQSGRT